MNETIKRAISGLIYVVLLLCCALYKNSLAILFGFFLIIAVYEFCKIASLNFYTSILVSIALYILLWKKNLDSNSVWIIATLLSVATLLFLLFYLFKPKKENFSKTSFYIILLGYIIIPFILINYVPIGKENKFNEKILITIFILIWTNDTFAYLVGKNFGKNKLFPSVSPKKTIEGFIGGIIFTIICSILLSKFYIESKILYIWIIIAIIVGIFSTLGDLIQSKFKRVAGVKDSGTIMPGHGGILDRLDSIIFVVPFISLFNLILYTIKYYVS